MYKLSTHSKTQRHTLYPWLQLTLNRALLKHDFRIDQGGRTDKEQWDLFNHDPPRTRLHPPNGKHLLRRDPSGEISGLWSFAADICPYINGKRLDTSAKGFGPTQQAQFAYFLSMVKAEADIVLMGTRWELRLGINWDSDAEIISDQAFDDWFHVELVYVGE